MEIKYVSEPNLNKRVSKIMENIIGEVRNQFNPKSIIITGSLGRGGGIVSEDLHGNILFHSDCEMIIYPLYNILEYKKIHHFQARIYERYGIKLDISGFVFTIQYLLKTSKTLRLKPTLGNYDLKYGSSVVYGRNILDSIEQINPGDIPFWEGLRLVFNRMAELLEHYSSDIRKSQLTPEHVQEVHYKINKLVLATQDLLLIRNKYYYASYRQRNIIFQSIFPKEYGELYARIPGFTALTIRATNARLGTVYVDDMDLFLLWDEVLAYIDEILRYILLEEFEISYNSYFEFREYFLSNSHVKNKCYRGLSPRPIYQNTKCILISTLLLKNDFMLKQSRLTKPWFRLVYSAIPVLYFSTYCGDKQAIKTQYSREGEHLRHLLDDLPISCGMIESNEKDEWDRIKQQIINLWKLVCCSCGE